MANVTYVGVIQIPYFAWRKRGVSMWRILGCTMRRGGGGNTSWYGGVALITAPTNGVRAKQAQTLVGIAVNIAWRSIPVTASFVYKLAVAAMSAQLRRQTDSTLAGSVINMTACASLLK